MDFERHMASRWGKYSTNAADKQMDYEGDYYY